jgi:hypothetical protein
MNFESLKKQILNMKLGERETIYKIDENTEIFVNKPLKVPAKLKQSKRYDPKKNFQIGLKKAGKKEFLPNHLRILIDLQLKKDDNSEKAEILFDAIEHIYKGADTAKYKAELSKLKFNREMENSFTDLCLAQLFMLEQDINYDFGKIQPPRSYLMGYIRMIRSGVEEIDKLLWSSIRHAPKKEFRETTH